MSASAPALEATGLCLVVRCHAWVLALAALHVDRVAGTADLPEPLRPAFRGAPAALGHLATPEDGVRHAAWDLGQLLGLGDVAGAWVLLRLPFGGRRLPVALRTGPCLGVSALARTAVRPLPLAAFGTERRAAIGGAVALDQLGRQAAAEGALGLEIRPELLLTRAELELSAAWLEAPAGEPA
ncbi:MAG: hypothetical protein ABW221_08550 [Vicinamibacteria bacterium]